MTTSPYEFTPVIAKPGHSHSRYRKPVALVAGEIRGVPFRQVFKTWGGAERLHAAMFGSQLLPL